MAFRFHRRVTLFPGVRLNIGKTGVSVSAGIRGASITAGKRGIYGNVGAPGTGMSYRTRLDRTPAHQRRLQRQQQREQVQQQQRTETREAKLTLDERGKLLLNDEQGAPLTPAIVRKLWQNHSAQIHAFLQKELERINDDQALLTEIHHDVPALSTPPPEFERQSFTEAKPKPPLLPDLPAEPAIQPKRWWHAIFNGLERKRRTENEQQQAEWRSQYEKVEQQRGVQTAHYEQQLQQWSERKAQHDQEQAEHAAAFEQDLLEDQNFMTELLSSELAQLDWPRETHVDFEVVNGVVNLDVDLPEPDQFPSREARFSKNGKRLLIKNKSATQQRKEYAVHAHGVVLRLVGVVLVTLPAVNKVTVSAYTQQLDEATGHDTDQYLLAVTVKRSEWGILNLNNPERINPIAALESFTLNRNMTKTGIFHPITL
ncbi:DUF4236 domain-containing protein [Aliidiomarina celeris]|uniref:DUF4236 domain-containing protein n=1 Tax=Aliidiomarina celeris TaxID=2249428 RepID=UPI000DEBA0AA|nr:DUF4236 domain-containing protein [Aliidiomarina celeris]